MAMATTHMTAMNVGGRRKEPLVFEPELIGGLKSMSIRKVACGDMFTACLTGKLSTYYTNNIYRGDFIISVYY